jgi:ABC-type sugar transport system ATPase subunit
MMVGREFTAKPRQTGAASGEAILSVRNLCTKKLTDLSFDLHRGEILGIAGLVGAGRTELGEALFALDTVLSGTMVLNGAPYTPKGPRDAMKAGLGLIPEDRKKEGLFIQQSVSDNMSVSIMEQNQRFGFVHRDAVLLRVSEMISRTRLKAATPQVGINTLSGGNQQKALVCRSLMTDPLVFFLDDPTRGVDVGAKEDIYEIMEQLAAKGKGILFVSSELPELLRSADRIMVLHDGRIAGIVRASETDQQELMRLAMGYGENKNG